MFTVATFVPCSLVPVIAGVPCDVCGSYSPAFALLAVLFLISAVGLKQWCVVTIEANIRWWPPGRSEVRLWLDVVQHFVIDLDSPSLRVRNNNAAISLIKLYRNGEGQTPLWF